MNRTMRTDRYQQDEVLSAVLSAGSVLLFCHVSPDGDTLGSALALYRRLRRMGKSVCVVQDGAVPDYLAFLPAAQEVRRPDEVQGEFDLALAVDVATHERLGAAAPLFDKAQATALIDHHGTGTGYAAANMVDADAPATAVLIYRLFAAMDMPIDREEAVCLYTALSTDTGNFIYDSTNAESFRIMGALMEAGLPLSEYSRLLFRQKELQFVKLLGEVLPSLRLSCNGRVAGLRLTMEQMRRVGADGGHTEGIVNYAIDIKGVSMAYFAREVEGGRVKVSLRSLEPCHVDGVAAQFGGGGHKLAAGLTLEGTTDEAAAVVEAALAAALGGEA